MSQGSANTIVRMRRNMKPYREGEDRVFPTDVATKLIKAGDAEDPRPFPPPDVAPPVRETLTLKRAPGYFTRRHK